MTIPYLPNLIPLPSYFSFQRSQHNNWLRHRKHIMGRFNGNYPFGWFLIILIFSFVSLFDTIQLRAALYEVSTNFNNVDFNGSPLKTCQLSKIGPIFNQEMNWIRELCLRRDWQVVDEVKMPQPLHVSQVIDSHECRINEQEIKRGRKQERKKKRARESYRSISVVITRKSLCIHFSGDAFQEKIRAVSSLWRN